MQQLRQTKSISTIQPSSKTLQSTTTKVVEVGSTEVMQINNQQILPLNRTTKEVELSPEDEILRDLPENINKQELEHFKNNKWTCWACTKVQPIANMKCTRCKVKAGCVHVTAQWQCKQTKCQQWSTFYPTDLQQNTAFLTETDRDLDAVICDNCTTAMPVAPNIRMNPIAQTRFISYSMAIGAHLCWQDRETKYRSLAYIRDRKSWSSWIPWKITKVDDPDLHKQIKNSVSGNRGDHTHFIPVPITAFNMEGGLTTDISTIPFPWQLKSTKLTPKV